nr:MAG TPA: hypothetical protein [Caudoviricetes sp.]
MRSTYCQHTPWPEMLYTANGMLLVFMSCRRTSAGNLYQKE